MKWLMCAICALGLNAYAQNAIKISGELRALNTQNFSPPQIKDIWQYTIAFMAEDGSVVQAGMPVLMFKTDAIQTKLDDAKGQLAVKKSELNNNKALEIENFEKKRIDIEQKKMELDKAKRKAELPKSILAQNDYQKNQLRYALAQKQYDLAQVDYQLSQKKAKTEEQIIQAQIKKFTTDISNLTESIKSLKIQANSTGIVMHKSSWQGGKYAPGDNVWRGENVIEVADLQEIIAKLEISENNIKHVSLDQGLIIKLDALPDKEYTGRIKSIDQVVRIKSKNQPSKILEAMVEFEQVDTDIMRPGMRLTAFINPATDKH